MTLRTALVIEGDASGAKAALEETRGALESVGKAAEGIGGPLGAIGDGVEKAGGAAETAAPKFEWLDEAATRARLGLNEAGEAGGAAAGPVREAGDAAGGAVKPIEDAGIAAGAAAPKFSSLRTALIGIGAGFAGGLAASLIAAGLGAAAGAAADLAREITSNTPRIERDLKAHEELVGRIKRAYDEARGAASSYGLTSTAQLRFEGQQDVSRLERDLGDATRDIEGRGAFAPIMQQVAPVDRLGPLREEVTGFLADLRAGEADVISFRERVAEIAEALPDDSAYRRLAETIFEDTQAAAELQAELERARDLLSGLKGNADAAATALGGAADRYRALGGAGTAAGDGARAAASGIAGTGEAAGEANPALAETVRLLREIEQLRGAAGTGASPARGALEPITAGRTFAAGGFTGHMPADQIAGFVHGSEYVFDAQSTARIGVANLDAIRSGVTGYAQGGYVGTASGAGASSDRGVADLLSATDLLRGAFRDLAGNVFSGASALDILKQTALKAADRLFQIALTTVENQLFGSAGGSASGIGGIVGNLLGGGVDYFPPAPAAIGVGLYHAGGMVGPAPTASRMVSPAVFVGAPRHHSGGDIGPGERPLIAKDGEEIGWPADLRRKYGGGQTVNNYFHVETPTPAAFAEDRVAVMRGANRLLAQAGRHS